uniref:RCC1 domain containing 1 n=1 Tax=Monopterus albus TaxID=43700 RepID=A0A3Q3KDB8_MONAL
MRWFGFGFNAFGQILKVFHPKELRSYVERSGCCLKTSRISASWSRRASLHLDGECVREIATLTLCKLDLNRIGYTSCCFPGYPLNLPLVTGGYIAPKPPFYRPLSPHLTAKSLALGAKHAILLSVSGAVYTWGLGSHGQLGHGGLTSEEEPRVVEALWGMPMSCVATGGWHSVCISDGGDLYVWGWNESGQLGLPSRALCQDTASSPSEKPQDGEKHEVFISIQAFPALLDVTPSCEIRTISCGSRHTAAVTSEKSLLAVGEYGQLGHQTLISLDEPQRVEFFKEQQMCVVDVVCGAWNTFAAVAKEEVACS